MRKSIPTRTFNKTDVSSIFATMPTGNFNVTFQKPNGATRIMHCQLTKADFFKPSTSNLVPVYDATARKNATINLDSVVKISTEERIYLIK
jgi:hypothetical protein